ncbi:VOC family protein [Leptolyngbya sp. CCNP1308]|uniref:VOC family protein n=1 Tax=Leptolyngbya sp. CCNP1308 TaxID=3110255 RepID=UPI002B21F74F|nr:VOC family protein [Leptolyngbya sp. CCNP1308]MEA5451645.1 VOC family protein [Leptolyngbya sp. CCNP1308]
MDVLINIDVNDLAAAERFYTRTFDLRPGRRLGDTIVELVGGPSSIFLLQKEAGSQASPQTAELRRFDRHWTPVHLDFVVEDIEATANRAVEGGARQESPIQQTVWGKIAPMADPFGNGFCLIQFVGQGYDEMV